MRVVLWIAIAGTIGTLSRYYATGLVQRWSGTAFPYGTLAVNLAGSFLFGLVWVLAEQRMAISAPARMAILIGFMGAFTTFSTFAFETGQMLRDRDYLMAAVNLMAQNAGGVLLFFAGLRLGQML